MVTYTKECPNCGSKFQTIYADKIYCSRRCGQTAGSHKWKSNPDNQQKINDWVKENMKRKREFVFQILGGKCIGCGIDDPDVLTVDHIDSVGKDRKQTITLYTEITNFPDASKEKYQLLCRNCNWKKLIAQDEFHNHRGAGQFYACEWQLQALYSDLKGQIDRIESIMKMKLIKRIMHPEQDNNSDDLNRLIKLVLPIQQDYCKDREINATKMKVCLSQRYSISIGHNKAYELKAALIMTHPELFDASD